jgi:hypothetical protein
MSEPIVDIIDHLPSAAIADFLVSLNVMIWALVQKQGGEITLSAEEIQLATRNVNNLITTQNADRGITLRSAVEVKGEH